MKLTTNVKKQHTVPRFLLDNFGFGKKNKKRKLFTYDKRTSRVFQQSVYDATTRNSFYNLKNTQDNKSLEPILSKIESEVAPIIKKIIKYESLSILTEEDKYVISLFTVIQRSRTYSKYIQLNSFTELIKDKFINLGIEEKVIDEYFRDDTLENNHNLFIDMISESKEFTKYIINKDWILYKTTESNPFIISDNPIALHNNVQPKNKLLGTLGYDVEGIEIYFPISSTLTLSFICSSIYSETKYFLDQVFNNIKLESNESIKKLDIKSLLELIRAIENGICLECNNENVRFMNSLQVSFSEQYLFSKKESFEMADEMIKDNKRFRKGRQIQVN
jgi:hypothetical protein